MLGKAFLYDLVTPHPGLSSVIGHSANTVMLGAALLALAKSTKQLIVLLLLKLFNQMCHIMKYFKSVKIFFKICLDIDSSALKIQMQVGVSLVIVQSLTLKKYFLWVWSSASRIRTVTWVTSKLMENGIKN